MEQGAERVADVAPRKHAIAFLLAVALGGTPALAQGPGAGPAPAPGSQGPGSGDLSIELVDPQVLRVCSDPRNLPFSNEKGEGFENKIAELLAGKLGKRLAYTWYPSSPGFVRNTLAAHKCDLIMGYPQ